MACVHGVFEPLVELLFKLFKGECFDGCGAVSFKEVIPPCESFSFDHVGEDCGYLSIRGRFRGGAHKINGEAGAEGLVVGICICRRM
jgi:hypothetical protein